MSGLPPGLTPSQLQNLLYSTPPPVPAVLNPNVTGDPRGTALSIGSVTFQDLEHPSEIEFALEQKLAVHEYVGGGRKVQSMGQQPKDVTWKGTFWYNTAKVRSQTLKRMCADGKNQVLRWGQDAYSVIVKEYVPKFINDYCVEYTITVTVESDKSGTYTNASTTSVDSQTQNLYQQVQVEANNLASVDTGATVAGFVSSITSIGSQLSTLGPIAQALGPGVTSLLGTLSSTIASVNTYIVGLQGILNTITGPMPATTAQQLSYATRLLNNLKMIQGNLNAGQTVKTITVNGGSLFAIASQQYGDPTLATVLQQANGLKTMMLPQGVKITLRIPPATANPLG